MGPRVDVILQIALIWGQVVLALLLLLLGKRGSEILGDLRTDVRLSSQLLQHVSRQLHARRGAHKRE